MRKYVLIFLILFSSFELCSQFKRGDFESSLAGNISSSTLSINYRGESELIDIYNYRILLSPGYYLIDGLSISADLKVNIEKFVVYDELSKEKFGILNLSYTYLFPDSKIGVFLKAGYGFSDAPVFSKTNYINRDQSSSFKGKVLNIGCGIKILVNKNFILTAEGNYREIRWVNKYLEQYFISDNPQILEMNFKAKRFCIVLGLTYLF